MAIEVAELNVATSMCTDQSTSFLVTKYLSSCLGRYLDINIINRISETGFYIKGLLFFISLPHYLSGTSHLLQPIH